MASEESNKKRSADEVEESDDEDDNDMIGPSLAEASKPKKKKGFSFAINKIVIQMMLREFYLSDN